MSLPPCAYWRVWEGVEIEGLDEIGKRTLFVRSATIDELVPIWRDYKRVWFTKEFDTWFIVKGMIEAKKVVALEVTPDTYDKVPTFVLENGVIYLKLGDIDFDAEVSGDVLHAGGRMYPTDEVNYACFGVPFNERCYKVAGRRLVEGAKVVPGQYLEDRRLL